MTRSMLESQRLDARPYSLSALQKYAVVSLPVPALGDLPARAAARHRAAAEARSADARLDLPRGAGAVLPRAEGGRPPAGAPRPTCRTRWPRSTRVIAAVAAEYEERARARHRSRVARRDRRHRPRPPRLGPPAAAEQTGWEPALLRVRVRPAGRRRARSRQRARPGPGRRPLQAARFGRPDRSETRTADGEPRASASISESPITRPGKNRTTWKTVIGGGAILQPVLYSLAVEQALQARVTVRPALLLHVGRRLRRSRDSAQRGEPPHRARGARDRRSRDRARVPAGGAGGTRVHLVRFPSGLRSGRAAARREQGAGEARRSRRAEREAVTGTHRSRPTPNSQAQSPDAARADALRRRDDDRERARRDARRRSRGRHGQDDRARQPHRPHPGERARRGATASSRSRSPRRRPAS